MATGQDIDVLPDDLAARALDFVERQLPDSARGDRFAPARPVRHDASAIERLVGFLGRPPQE